jgi:hypothetical protein
LCARSKMLPFFLNIFIPSPSPRAIKYLKRVLGYGPGSFALISCAYGAIGNRMHCYETLYISVARTYSAFCKAECELRSLAESQLRWLTPIILARPSMFLSKIFGDGILRYSIFQYYYSERRIIQYLVPAFFTV